MRWKPGRRNVSALLVAASWLSAISGCGRTAAPTPNAIAQTLARLSTHERAALTVAAALRPSGDSLPSRLLAELATGSAAAVTVARADLPQAEALLAGLPGGAWGPLMVVVEMDGGAPGSGVPSGPGALPAGRFIAAVVRDADVAEAAGEVAGRGLFAFGGDLAIIELPPLSSTALISGAGSIGTPAAMLSAYLGGVSRGGIAAAARAFAPSDSSAAPLRWDLARLMAIELPAFDSILGPEIAAVALGASRLPAITGDSLPLPLSEAAVRGLLRRDLGYDGVVMADLSPASPVMSGRGAGEAAVAALAAGVDLLLGVEEPAVVVDAIAAAVENGRLPRTRLTAAAGRVLHLRRDIGVGDSVRAARRAAAATKLENRLDHSGPAQEAAPLRTGAASESGEQSARVAEVVRLATALAAASTPREADSLLLARTPDSVPSRGGSAAQWPPAPTLSVVAPDSVDMEPDVGARIDALMLEALEDSVFSGAAVAIGRRGGLVVLRGYGRSGLDGGGAAVDPRRTIFDIASMTKVVGTTTAVALLVDDGRMTLDAPLRRYLPRFDGDDKEDVGIRHLLTHTSGLPSGLWIFGSAGSPQEALRQILEQPLLREPGEGMEYSDLGMILLAAAAERAAEMPLDQYLARRVFAPLGMEATMYLPPLALHPAIVPTAGLTERDFPLKGIVHDANAFRLGGVAGHAGLFSTAGDLAIFAQMMLNGGSFGTLRILSPETVAAFTQRQPGAEQRALGWDTPSRVSSAGAYFSARSFGHTGYTGTSLWMDPASGVFVVLLTNRTYTKASARDILRLRAAVHDAAARAVTDISVRRR